MTALLEARHVTKVFGGGGLDKAPDHRRCAISRSASTSEPPTITAIVGESGSGKTTLARLAPGAGGADERGGALPRARICRRLTTEERRRFLRDVQVIFQDPYEVYNPFYKVDHVLETPISEVQAGVLAGAGAGA